MANPVIEIIINKNNSYATGMYFDDGSIEIYKGSKVCPYLVPKASKNLIQWRKRIENEVLDSRGIFTRNYVFPNYSSCVSSIIGRDDNAGAIETVENITLEEFLNEKEKRDPLCFSITCRPDAYDVDGAFKALDSIWWRQSVARIRKDDIVYIYVAKPIQSYIYKCLVLQSNVPEEYADLAKDAQFILDIAALPEKRNYMELKLIEKGDLPVSLIKEEMDFNSFALRKQFLLSNEMAALFAKYFNKQPSLADLDDNEPIEYYYSNTSNSETPKRIISSSSRYIRSAYERQKALELSNHKCQISGCKHELFFNKNGEPYLEIHHIIPMNAQDRFEVSIDVAENMVSLCPSCHREIHNGRDAEKMIGEIYYQRKRLLNNKQIVLKNDLEELLSFYGIKK